MKKPILSLPPWMKNLPEGTISGLLGTLVAVLVIIACAAPPVCADNTTPTATATATATASPTATVTATATATASPTATATATATATQTATPIQAPVASFSYYPLNPKTADTVTFTDTSSGSPTGYSWIFGNGNTDNTKNPPAQTYSTAGSYSVSLMVSSSGGQSSVEKTIIVGGENLEADFDFTPNNPKADEKVTFTDESKGDPDGWTWDFGDKTASSDAQHPSHKYAKDGIYTVKLTVKKSGASDNSITKTITVGDASLTPTASFTWEPSTPVVGSPVSFKDTSTGGGITEWKWDFDDKMDFTGNRKSILQNPQHTYENPGVYQVELFVRNSVGTGDIIVKQVTVRSVSLNARFSASPTSGTVPLSVRFVDSSTGTDIKSYEWDFGNGQTYSGKSPSNPVVYSSPGTYRPSLKIVDERGSYNEYTTTIIVNPPATATIAPLAATPIATPTSDGGGDGFIGGEYRKMTGLYNEYIRLIFGFLGMADEPDFLIFAVEKN